MSRVSSPTCRQVAYLAAGLVMTARVCAQFYMSVERETALRAGQSNYAYANAVVDQLVKLRRSLSLPGTAFQWGPIADVGFVAETMQVCIRRFGRQVQSLLPCCCKPA